MIVLFRGTDPLSRLIRLQTRGEYSHAAWMLRNGSVIEAHMRGGVVHSHSPFVRNATEIDVFAVRGETLGRRKAVEAFLREQLGAGYDAMAILRFLSKVNRDNYDRWFCSELVAEACEEAGMPLLRAPAYLVSPVTLSWSTELELVVSRAGIDWWEERFGRVAIPRKVVPEIERLEWAA